MLELIEQNRLRITDICRQRGVKRLELFGSAARGDFKPGKSDFDFFVEFTDYAAPTIADQWFGLQEDLSALLDAPVELVSLRTASNPYFLEVANRSKVMLYAA
ncbi:MAG TPA: nucleotidyltransferase domain-containing protein [Tepidisphaeraceae bacterium]|nr:nucleotidyltransferase domain-containing protein [Tepidisphaeraceae bacterium]